MDTQAENTGNTGTDEVARSEAIIREIDRETARTTPGTPAPGAAAPVKMLSKADIEGAKDIQTEIVAVPEWGGSVRVSVMDGPSRDQWEVANLHGKGKNQKFSYDNIRAITAAFTIVDEDGKRMFTKEEIQSLAKKSGAALARVWEVAARLNGLTKDDVEEIAGNSSDGPSDVS